MKEVSLSKLKQYPSNPRIGSIDLIAQSLEEHGQYRPLIVNSDNVILAGNHTYLAMKKLKWKKAQVHYVEVDDEQARKIVLVDNRLNDVAGYNREIFMSLIEDLQDAGELEGTGFTPDDIDSIMAEFAVVDITDFEKFEGGYALSEEELQVITDQREANVPKNKGKPLNDIPISLKEKEYNLYKNMVMKIAEHKKINVTEATLFALEHRYSKDNSWLDKFKR